jgi:hypothetical protein
VNCEKSVVEKEGDKVSGVLKIWRNTGLNIYIIAAYTGMLS